MKTRGWLLTILCSLFAQCGPSQGYADKNQSHKAVKGVTVVELFTSEGCSSCPAADALMPVIQNEFGDQVIILSFHVDYWNRLGWKDVYSKAEYSKRQNQYAAAFGADNIYTPQAIVNGRDQTTGSNRAALTAYIRKAQNQVGGAIVNEVVQEKDGECTVICKGTIASGEVISLTLVQQHATSVVGSGENSGRTLKHYNVVREFRVLKDPGERATFRLPAGQPVENIRIVALRQDLQTMRITAAQEVRIQ